MKKVGFSATYGFASIEDAVIYASDHGFDMVEINLNIPEFFPERYEDEERKKIRGIAEEKGITLTFHAPEDINLCSMQKSIVEAGINKIKASIDFACSLGGKRFTFHIGDSVVFTMFDGSIRLEDYYEEKFIPVLTSALSNIASYGIGRIIICAENTGYFSSAKMKAVKQLLGKGLYLTWDIGHSFIKKDQEKFMFDNIDYVMNAHIHDVRGGKDHCIIGTGEVDIKHYMDILDSRGICCIIEVRPADAAYKSFLYLKGRSTYQRG